MVVIGNGSTGRVLQHLAADNSVDREMLLVDDVTRIGRGDLGFSFPDDTDMADWHAEVCVHEDTIMIRDSGEGTGVWIRVVGSQGRLLRSDDQVWLGSQILVIRKEADAWRLRHHGPDGRLRETHAVSEGGVFIGRVSELPLDPEDARLSRRHAQLVPEGDELRLYDRGAHNGTYVKLVADEPLSDGDEFRVANSRFRFVTLPSDAAQSEGEAATPADRGDVNAPDTAADNATDNTTDEATDDTTEGGTDNTEVEAATVVFQPDEVSAVERSSSDRQSEKAPSALSVEAPRKSSGLGARLRRMGRRVAQKTTDADSPASPVNGDEATIVSSEALPDGVGAEKVLVVIDSDDGSVSLEVFPGKTILEAVQEAGLGRGAPVDWECGDGGCGVCVVGVVEGASRMDPPDPETGEMKTIQITEQVVPDPAKYRLACLARVRGTVRLRKL
jgi:ferredoxin/pSer/pThr/pTyr-binding forkhead associated (FHA) protein